MKMFLLFIAAYLHKMKPKVMFTLKPIYTIMA